MPEESHQAFLCDDGGMNTLQVYRIAQALRAVEFMFFAGAVQYIGVAALKSGSDN